MANENQLMTVTSVGTSRIISLTGVIAATVAIVIISVSMDPLSHRKHEIQTNDTIAITWEYLSDNASIRTVDHKDCPSERFGGDGYEIFKRTDCLNHFNSKDLTAFLIDQISDTTLSKTRVYPHNVALKCEATNYCFQEYTLSNGYPINTSDDDTLFNDVYIHPGNIPCIPIQSSLRRMNKTKKSHQLTQLWARVATKKLP